MVLFFFTTLAQYSDPGHTAETFIDFADAFTACHLVFNVRESEWGGKGREMA